ncbi:MAG: hypothetical protein DI629_18590 [Mesorhizobium amorphae]|nr:MAG: hypothetical protein DI629_18590 [Mesorhizobium amorphae]
MPAFLSLAATGLLVGGCVSSPTYGTGTTANQQLMSDMSNILALAPKERPAIEYKPRAELVRPAPGAPDTLPPPQASMASAENPDWPESPEQRRARIRAAATENQDNPYYQAEVSTDGGPNATRFTPENGGSPRARERIVGNTADTRRSREAFNQKLAESRQGSPNTRKYLSEPPLTYRQPSEAAPTDDVGEDEWKKERRLKAEAKKKAGGGGWFDWLPGT